MEIRENQIGKGLFALKKYEKGDLIHVLTGNMYNYPTRETIHIGNNQHIYDEYGIFINHSFTPNMVVDKTSLIALETIHENEELTFN